MCFSGQINNATPHTNYSIKIAACTGGGCTESTDGVVVFTNQEGNCWNLWLTLFYLYNGYRNVEIESDDCDFDKSEIFKANPFLADLAGSVMWGIDITQHL